MWFVFYAAVLVFGNPAAAIGQGTANANQDLRVEDHLDPRRAHARIPLIDHRGYRVPPDVRFYTKPDLRSAAALELNRTGFIERGTPICVWRPQAFEPRMPEGSTVLLSAAQSGGACPHDLPVRSFAEDPRWVFVELARLDGFVGTIVYRGARYYFDVSPIVGRRWERPWLVDWPKASPPFAGGVDIPRIFRPADRKAAYSITLRSEPNDAAPVVTTLTSTRYFEQFSIGNGAMLAAVYARSRRWSLLRVIDGRTGWIAPADSGKFVSAERLARRADGMHDWDWTLAPEPGSTDRRPVPHDPRRTWIGYLAVRESQSSSIPVFATTDRTTPPVALWDPAADMILSSVDSGGSRRPIVFSRRPGWLEVALDDSRETYAQESAKRAWIEDAPERWTVHAVTPDVAGALLSREWTPEGPPAAKVIETRTVNGRLWLRVQVFAGQPCEHEMYPDLPWALLGEGWTPAHSRFGRLTVWFETYCD